jgi:hypothetical protein
VIRDAVSHRWRHAKGLVEAEKVINTEMKGNAAFEVVLLLGQVMPTGASASEVLTLGVSLKRSAT